MYNLDSFIFDLSKQMIEYIRVEYNAPNFDVRIRCDYSPHRKTSWGGIRNGKEFISLALNKYSIAAHYSDPVTFREYPSFADHSVIGSITGTWQKALAALIAHEMAHAVELGSIKQNASAAHGITPFGKHGALWKTIYRKLRIKFVNTEIFIPVPLKSLVVAKTEKPATKRKAKSWNAESYRSRRGIVVNYFQNNVQLGCLFKSDSGSIFLAEGNAWKKLPTFSLVEARKLCFNI